MHALSFIQLFDLIAFTSHAQCILCTPALFCYPLCSYLMYASRANGHFASNIIMGALAAWLKLADAGTDQDTQRRTREHRTPNRIINNIYIYGAQTRRAQWSNWLRAKPVRISAEPGVTNYTKRILFQVKRADYTNKQWDALRTVH